MTQSVEKMICSDCGQIITDEDDLIINDFNDPVCADCVSRDYEVERRLSYLENQPPDYDCLALEWGGMEGYRDVGE